MRLTALGWLCMESEPFSFMLLEPWQMHVLRCTDSSFVSVLHHSSCWSRSSCVLASFVSRLRSFHGEVHSTQNAFFRSSLHRFAVLCFYSFFCFAFYSLFFVCIGMSARAFTFLHFEQLLCMCARCKIILCYSVCLVLSSILCMIIGSNYGHISVALLFSRSSYNPGKDATREEKQSTQ